jgi:hypothetical protein
VGSVTMVHVICRPSNEGDVRFHGRALGAAAPA